MISLAVMRLKTPWIHAGILCMALAVRLNAQCPLINNSSGNPTLTPLFVNCTGSVYALDFESNSSFPSYTISWGDSSPNTTGPGYVANTIITHTYPASVSNYTLTLFTSTCVVTATVVQEEPAKAEIAIPIGSNTLGCAPHTLTLTNTSTFTSVNTTFTWNFGGLSGTDVIHSYTNTNEDVTHTYNKGSVNCAAMVTLMASNYCNTSPSTATLGPVQIFEKDAAAITPDKFISCWPFSAFTFTNTSALNCPSSGNNTLRYERWNFGNYWGRGQDSLVGWNSWSPPSTPVSISYTAPGAYNVFLLDSSYCGVDTTFLTLLIIPSPTAGVTAPGPPLCENASLTFTNSGSAGYQYRWNFDDGAGFQNLGTGNKSHTYPVAGNHTVSVVAFFSTGTITCADTAHAPIQVSPLPVAGFSVSQSAGCGSMAVQFTDGSTGSVTAWDWDFGNGNNSTVQTPTVQNYLTPGSYTTHLKVTATSGCTASASGSLLVHDQPSSSFTVSPGCVVSPINFTNTSSVTGTNAISGYTWQFGDGGTSSGTNPSHTYTAPATYTVKLAAATMFCADSTEMSLVVFAKPTASFASTPPAGCSPLNINFTNLSQNATNFLWNFGAPTASSTSTGTNYIFTNLTASSDSHTVTLYAYTNDGCVDSIKQVVIVNPSPVAAFVSNVTSGCSPLTVSFTSSSAGITGYSWDFGDNGISAQPNPQHTYSNSTLGNLNYTVQLVVTNSFSCTDVATTPIQVYPLPSASFTFSPASGCSPLAVSLPTLSGFALHTWIYGDGSPSFTTNVPHTYTYVNTTDTVVVYNLQLAAATADGCLSLGAEQVTVSPSPKASFNTDVDEGCSPLTFTVNNNTLRASSYRWDFGNGETSTAGNPAVTYSSAPGSAEKVFDLKLVAEHSLGCRDSVVQQITLFAQPQASFNLPSIICPNNPVTFINRSPDGPLTLWRFPGNIDADDDTTSYSFSNNSILTQTQTVTLVVANEKMCMDSVAKTISVFPATAFGASVSTVQGCSPFAVRFTRNSNALSANWLLNGTVLGNSADFTHTFTNTLTTTQNLNVMFAAADTNGCADTIVKIVRVNPTPTATFSVDRLDVTIPDSDIRFTNTSPAPASTFKWYFGDGGTSAERNPVYTYTAPGQFQPQLIVISASGCSDTLLLSDKILVQLKTLVRIPNAFTPNTAGSRGGIFDPNDLSNDIFRPHVSGVDKYRLSVFSRWGELKFDTDNPAEGWDGYYKGNLCEADVYVWKLSITFADGTTYSKAGEVMLIR